MVFFMVWHTNFVFDDSDKDKFKSTKEKYKKKKECSENIRIKQYSDPSFVMDLVDDADKKLGDD